MLVKYLDHFGSDNSVANTARISMVSEGGEIWHELPRDYDEWSRNRLLKYLACHGHWTPFGHPHITLHVSAPVPIRTQCFKSKVGFCENEESRRYIRTTPELYVPDEFRSAPEGNIKQGSGDVHKNSDDWKFIYKNECTKMINLYEEMIADNVAPEQARFILPQGCEVNWVWTGSLAAYARFCNLRKDKTAQAEVSELASKVSDIIRPLFPVSWEALVDRSN